MYLGINFIFQFRSELYITLINNKSYVEWPDFNNFFSWNDYKNMIKIVFFTYITNEPIWCEIRQQVVSKLFTTEKRLILLGRWAGKVADCEESASRNETRCQITFTAETTKLADSGTYTRDSRYCQTCRLLKLYAARRKLARFIFFVRYVLEV